MSTRGRPRLALPHGEVELEPDHVALLRAAAAALAGQSSVARDLSLLLDRALQQDGPVVLRRPEVKMLEELAASNQLNDIVRLLSAAA